jgi:hypothetical protein
VPTVLSTGQSSNILLTRTRALDAGSQAALSFEIGTGTNNTLLNYRASDTVWTLSMAIDSGSTPTRTPGRRGVI